MNQSSQPNLSVRAFAEMIALPAYEQVRILTEQKYPRQSAASFKIPYYQPALTAIGRHYRRAHDPVVLREALMEFPNHIGNQVRAANNDRVLRAFQKHACAQRKISPKSYSTLRTTVEGVALRLSYDLVGEEAKGSRYVFFNCRAAALDAGVARLTLELAHWTMEQGAASVPLRDLEYVDLHSGQVFNFSRRRESSVRLAKQNAKIVRQLWDGI